MFLKFLNNINKQQSNKGFTLIELLIVIALIAILAGVVFVALDPLTRFQDARDSSRWTDATAVLSAIKVDQVDNGGYYLTSITNATQDVNYMISSTTPASGCNLSCDAVIASGNDCINLQGLVDEGYLPNLPVSPNGTGSWTTEFTGYYLTKNANGSITVGACESENTPAVSVTQ